MFNFMGLGRVRKVKVAALQSFVSHTSGRQDACLKSAERLLREAGRSEVDVACLPELFLGSQVPAERLPGPTSDWLAIYAEEYGMCIIANTFIEVEDGARYNANIIIGRNGEVIGYQPKMHLFPWEGSRSKSQPPLQGPGVTPGPIFKVFDLDFGKIGSYVCHDHCFPESARILTLKGAEIIFCATRDPDPFQIPWREMSISRAIENQVYIVSVGAHYNDCSTHIVSPIFRGGVLAESGLGHRMVSATLNLDWLEKERKDSLLYYLKTRKERNKILKKVVSYCFINDRRPEIYKDLTT